MMSSVPDAARSESPGVGCALLLIDEETAAPSILPETLRDPLPHARLDVCCPAHALECLRAQEYHVVISDLTRCRCDAEWLLAGIERERPGLPVLVLANSTQRHAAVKAMQAGAYDVILMPFEREQLLLSLKRALEVYELRTYSERQDLLTRRLSQQLRQLQQVLRPFLLSSLKAIGRELGDERIEQSRTILDTAVSLCATQLRIVGRRLEFVEAHLAGIRDRLDHADGLAAGRPKEAPRDP